MLVRGGGRTGPAVPEDWREFLACSARLGRDLSLVQAAGGNTSIKCGGVLWIKASGTWLARAEQDQIMVPVDLARLRARLEAGDLTEAGIPALTLRTAGAGAATMRASVETPFHALFNARCVLHVHCVATIAHAIRPDAGARLAARLAGIRWQWQPYLKPGLPLTQALRDSGAAGAEVVVLGNHGLIVTGDSPAEAYARLHEVRARLAVPTPPADAAFRALKTSLSGSGYQVAPGYGPHALGQDAGLLAHAGDCALAPDFVVFFGPRIPVLSPGPDLMTQLAALARQPVPLNAVVIVAGHGCLIREQALRGTADLLRGYHLVLEQHRALGGGDVNLLPDDRITELLNWDAETYRQSLNGLVPGGRT